MVAKISFAKNVHQIIEAIPVGKVVSYSQVAAMCSKPGAARAVGQIAHFGPSKLPWHRLVKADGGLASGFVPGGPNRQKELLELEGVKLKGAKVIMKECQL